MVNESILEKIKLIKALTSRGSCQLFWPKLPNTANPGRVQLSSVSLGLPLEVQLWLQPQVHNGNSGNSIHSKLFEYLLCVRYYSIHWRQSRTRQTGVSFSLPSHLHVMHILRLKS